MISTVIQGNQERDNSSNQFAKPNSSKYDLCNLFHGLCKKHRRHPNYLYKRIVSSKIVTQNIQIMKNKNLFSS